MRSRVKMNAQSSRMNHWLRPTMNSTTTAPASTARNAHVAPSSEPAQATPRRRRLSTSTDHHVPPQCQELASAAGDGRQPEKLRFSGWSKVVMNGKLDEPCAGAIER